MGDIGNYGEKKQQQWDCQRSYNGPRQRNAKTQTHSDDIVEGVVEDVESEVDEEEKKKTNCYCYYCVLLFFTICYYYGGACEIC